MERHSLKSQPWRGVVRQLRPSDLPRFRDHLLRLDAESRHDRFNGVTNDAYLSAYAERSFHDGATVIGYVEDGKVLGAAELHERPDLSEPTGEIAFSVEHELQHRGIGSALFERLITNARGLGYEKLRVTTHPGNLAMRALARKFDAHLSFENLETVGVIDLGRMAQTGPAGEKWLAGHAPSAPERRRHA
jgi:RimJ/RimL family protein N-acetyltransferase